MRWRDAAGRRREQRNRSVRRGATARSPLLHLVFIPLPPRSHSSSPLPLQVLVHIADGVAEITLNRWALVGGVIDLQQASAAAAAAAVSKPTALRPS